MRAQVEAMAQLAADELSSTLSTDACVDEWLQDQLIVFVALAAGTSWIRCACVCAVDERTQRQSTQAAPPTHTKLDAHTLLRHRCRIIRFGAALKPRPLIRAIVLKRARTLVHPLPGTRYAM